MLAISIKNLSKQFASSTVVDNVSFDVTKNHIVGFLGPNGAGKTTTLRMLVGLSKPTKGTISVSNAPAVFGGSAAHNKIGYLPEFPSMYRWMTGYEYLDFVADLFGLSKKEKTIKIAELLQLVDLIEAKDKRISTFSGGMKQRLGIAQALLGNPEVLILDEPVSALDPLGRKEVLIVIEKLKHTKTVLFSTHILSDVDRICDDVVIINNGKLVVSSSLATLKAQYASPILEVEFASDPIAITTKLQHENWVKKVRQENNLLRIWLKDSSVVAKNIPLEFITKHKIGILKYGLSLPETEDLFIELLGDRNE